MAMHVHEIHAAAIHAPLALVPAACAVDLQAALRGDDAYDGLGRGLWWAAAGAGLFAGLAGMAASQEVKTEDRSVEGTMWLHGAINVGIVAGSFAMAAWRMTHRPTLTQSLLGTSAALVSFYTAYLGGELVYSHGVGVKAMPPHADQGVRESTSLLSPRAPVVFVRDALRGLVWLLRTAKSLPRETQTMQEAATGGTPLH